MSEKWPPKWCTCTFPFSSGSGAGWWPRGSGGSSKVTHCSLARSAKRRRRPGGVSQRPLGRARRRGLMGVPGCRGAKGEKRPHEARGCESRGGATGRGRRLARRRRVARARRGGRREAGGLGRPREAEGRGGASGGGEGRFPAGEARGGVRRESERP